MKTSEKTLPGIVSPSLMHRAERERSGQAKKPSVPSLYRWELSLADLEAELLFVRNHRGEYCHTGVVDFQYTDLDFV